MSSEPQVTLKELLEDALFRKFFTTPPRLPRASRHTNPWRVYVQRESGSGWARRDFPTYAEAFKFLVPLIKSGKVHDGAIVSRRVAFAPPTRWVKVTKGGEPVWARDPQTGKVRVGPDGKKIQKQKQVPLRLPAGHQWCPYCRRPTVFIWFRWHHAFNKNDPLVAYDPTKRRCTICGISETGIHWRGGSEA